MSSAATGLTFGLGGLAHLGLVYHSPDGLRAGLLPRARASLAAGERVSALLDRPTARGLRAALGPDAEVTFTAPREVLTASWESFVEFLRAAAGPRRGLVLVQYSVFALSDADLRWGEDAINRELAELPITLVCACAAGERTPRLTTLHATHPSMLDGPLVGDNDAYRSGEHPLEVPRPGDSHLLGLTFHGTGDLAHVRRHVRRVARAAGLPEADVRTAVLAVHEAALLVIEHAPDGDAITPAAPGPCSLDLWLGDHTLAAQLRGPRPAPATRADNDHPFAGDATGHCGGALHHLRAFCWEATCRENTDTRTIDLLPARQLTIL